MRTLIFFILVGLALTAIGYINEKHSVDHSGDFEVKHVDAVAQDERSQVLLKTCFPEGAYKADAAPVCPAFFAHLKNQLNSYGDTRLDEQKPE